jgi:cytochrome b pre-mRNA-processing protein 3
MVEAWELLSPTMRFPRFFKNSAVKNSAYEIYLRLVEQSRLPAFYVHCGVGDTPDGRFDMIALHAALVLRRLKQDGDVTAELAQEIFDLMFADMDQNLREMGVGDMGVGKRVKGMAQGFYGRLAAYDSGLAALDNEDLLAALRRNLYRKTLPTDAQVVAVAEYMRRESVSMDAQATSSLMSGKVEFGSPPGRASGVDR